MASKKKTSSKKAVKAKVKNKTSKKTAAKKKSAVKKSAKTSAVKQSPKVKKLIALTETLSSEEIDFLISQAMTMKRNHDLIKEQADRAESHDMVVKAMNPVKDKETIEIVEGEEGDHFIIVLGTERNFFDRDEMKKIVKLCHAATGEKDAMARLYTWFDRFRNDVIRNNEITGTSDRGLATIYNKIINTYTTS